MSSRHSIRKSNVFCNNNKRDSRRSLNSVGLESFAQRNGHVRALEEFKKRKNRKSLETSMANLHVLGC